ncbi:MAG TPA: hypothetical protein VMT18_02365 [Planctomycetota bacterium]|nr:hypothetical protein [Planctomycetota bacterium]
MLCASLPSLLFLHLAAPRAQDDLVRVAPESTRMVLVCEDVPGLMAGLRAGPLGALWADEALASMRADVTRELDQELDEEVFPGGPKASELIEGVEAAAMFFGPFEGQYVNGGALVVALRDELSNEVAAMLEGLHLEGEAVEVGGRTFLVQPGEDGNWLAWGEWLRGFVFGFASEREDALAWARDLVEGLDAEPARSTTLGAGLAQRRSRFPALQVHVKVGALIRDGVESEADDDEASLADLERLGLTRLGFGSLTLGTPPGGAVDLGVSLEVPRDGPMGKLCAALRPAPIALGRLAPRDTIDATFNAIDVQALWRSIEEMIVAFAPEFAEGAEQTPSELIEQRLQEVEALLGVDLRAALIDNLTGEFAGFALPQSLVGGSTGVSVGLLQMDGVGVVGLRDREAMEELIDAAIGLTGADARITEEELEGHWVQILDLSDLPLEGFRPCWTVLDDVLLVSYEPECLRAVLVQRAQDAPPSWLDDEARTRRARELVAQGACSLSIADAPELFRTRIVHPLRVAEASFEGGDPNGFSQTIVHGVVQSLLSEYAADEDASEKARALLREAIGACERLLDGGITGSFLTTLTWVDGTLGMRLWTEPALRD